MKRSAISVGIMVVLVMALAISCGETSVASMNESMVIEGGAGRAIGLEPGTYEIHISSDEPLNIGFIGGGTVRFLESDALSVAGKGEKYDAEAVTGYNKRVTLSEPGALRIDNPAKVPNRDAAVHVIIDKIVDL